MYVVCPAQVKMVNSTKKDYSSMSLLALEHFVHLADREGETMKPKLAAMGECPSPNWKVLLPVVRG